MHSKNCSACTAGSLKNISLNESKHIHLKINKKKYEDVKIETFLIQYLD